MKIHIVQRNDTFESIASRYGISVQDLIGTNTHINYTSGLVPGLKVKIPMPPRNEEPMVDQHIQKYYPSIDMHATYVQAASIEKTIQAPQAVEFTEINHHPSVECSVPQQSLTQPTHQNEQPHHGHVSQVDQTLNQPAQQTEQSNQQNDMQQQLSQNVEEVIPIPLKPMLNAAAPSKAPMIASQQNKLDDMNKKMQAYLFYLNTQNNTQPMYRNNVPSPSLGIYESRCFGAPFPPYAYYPYPYPYVYPYGCQPVGCGWW